MAELTYRHHDVSKAGTPSTTQRDSNRLTGCMRVKIARFATRIGEPRRFCSAPLRTTCFFLL